MDEDRIPYVDRLRASLVEAVGRRERKRVLLPRPRPALVTGIGLLVLLVVAVSFALTGWIGEQGGEEALLVARGDSVDGSWRLFVQDDRGSEPTCLVLEAEGGSDRLCPETLPGETGISYWLSPLGERAWLLFGLVDGDARRVVVTLADGRRLRIETEPLPGGARAAFARVVVPGAAIESIVPRP